MFPDVWLLHDRKGCVDKDWRDAGLGHYSRFRKANDALENSACLL